MKKSKWIFELLELFGATCQKILAPAEGSGVGLRPTPVMPVIRWRPCVHASMCITKGSTKRVFPSAGGRRLPTIQYNTTTYTYMNARRKLTSRRIAFCPQLFSFPPTPTRGGGLGADMTVFLPMAFFFLPHTYKRGVEADMAVLNPIETLISKYVYSCR